MKFGRYLQENLTPEWKRAYIDYRGCKKAIKVVATRLGQIRERQGVEDESSGADDDYGPTAPPSKRSPELGKSPGGSKSGYTASNSRLARTSSQPSEIRSPGYGSTEESAHPRPSPSPANPPPLDLGAPGVEDDYPTASPSRPDDPHLITRPEQVKHRDSQQRKGVAFSPTSEEISGQRIEELPEASNNSQSSDGDHLRSDSEEPLKKRPSELILKSGKFSSSPSRLGKSPRGLFSPRLTSIRGDATPTSRSDRSPARSQARSLRSMYLPSPALSHRNEVPSVPLADTFEDLYDRLQPDEQAFFNLLGRELNKVENFYLTREQEAIKRAHDLKAQLRELAEHRKLYHEIYPEGIPEWEAKVGRLLPTAAQVKVPALGKLRNRLKHVFDEDEPSDETNPVKDPAGNAITRANSPVMNDHERQNLRQAMAEDKDHQTYNPERYQRYKKDLKNALLEYYRQLELVKNYRIMNLTGFRKALKKFEKVSKIQCLELYTDEKIVLCAFSKGNAIDDLIKKVEELYTDHFEHGDSKRAREKLRKQQREKTHYQSVFRSGIMIGIALPAAIGALAESGRAETRNAIPAWEALLQVYGALFLPVIFGMLFELNLMAFVMARINYEFVMELTRPTIDYRSFIELPAFLFLTLSYCFYFSFARIGSSNVDPTTWPAAWLVFLAVFWLNPLPILRRPTRYWLLKVLFRVMTPGYSKVEFIAFFLADELNSLIYTIQNIYFISCAYAHEWPGDMFSVCPSGKTWPYALLLCLPALSRLIQCLKRYHDSKLYIHLINAGKYSSVINQQCLFVLWRSKGSSNSSPSFIVWVIFATASAIYTCTWDLVIDWSLFRPKSALLRKDLGYSQRFVYYIAIVLNIIIRFIFVWYIPSSQNHVRLRSFFFALAEMLRRWQWNFFRVETEHLGNADAYRVTREVPLPYRRIHDSDSDDQSNSPSIEKSRNRNHNPLSVNIDRLRRGMHDQNTTEGRGPDALDAGPRGHRSEREYEARRPGDLMDSVPRGSDQV